MKNMKGIKSIAHCYIISLLWILLAMTVVMGCNDGKADATKLEAEAAPSTPAAIKQHAEYVNTMPFKIGEMIEVHTISGGSQVCYYTKGTYKNTIRIKYCPDLCMGETDIKYIKMFIVVSDQYTGKDHYILIDNIIYITRG